MLSIVLSGNPDRQASAELPRLASWLVSATLALAGLGAAIGAAAFCGRTEFTCIRQTPTRVDARCTVYHWFDLTSYDRFDLAGVRDAYSNTPTEVGVSTGGESPEDAGHFAGGPEIVAKIEEFIATSKVGQSLTIPNFQMHTGSRLLAVVAIAFFWAAWKMQPDGDKPVA